MSETRLLDIAPGSWVRTKIFSSDSKIINKIEFVVANDGEIKTAALSSGELEDLAGTSKMDIFCDKLKKVFNFCPNDGGFSVALSNGELVLHEKLRFGKATNVIGKVKLEKCADFPKLLRGVFNEAEDTSQKMAEAAKWEAEKKKLLSQRDEALKAVKTLEEDLYWGFQKRCEEYEQQFIYMEQASNLGYWRFVEEPPEAPSPSPSPSARGRGRGRGTRGRGRGSSTTKTSANVTPAKRTRSQVEPSTSASPPVVGKRRLIIESDKESDTADTVPDDEKSTVGGSSDEELFSIKQEVE